MHINATVRLVKPSLFVLAVLTLVAGVSGMAVSYLYLASADHLDVLAGTAGFVAGSILVGAGLISISLQRPAACGQRSSQQQRATESLEPPVAVDHWLAHFRRNRENRAEPDWNAPVASTAEVVRALVKSLDNFNLATAAVPLI